MHSALSYEPAAVPRSPPGSQSRFAILASYATSVLDSRPVEMSSSSGAEGILIRRPARKTGVGQRSVRISS